ncbi:MAG TPA: hypothetical protein VFX43_01395 [Chitinophagaceae bacterium]|jgi:uncharacterized protein YlxW (UPF0749 family)|nr:hypothetical protein [Chitinophagaceae bacterium]
MAAVISRLEEKFQLLLKKVQLLQEENQRLQNAVLEGQKQLQETREAVKELESKIALSKIATTTGNHGPGSQDQRAELRSTINKYIREIDHCIAQLNE